LDILNPIYWKNNSLHIIDQTLLPSRLETISLSSVREVWTAIQRLQVRGAPAIGIAAGYGVVLSSLMHKNQPVITFKEKIVEDIDYLRTARPTAVNLFQVLDQFDNLITNSDETVPEICLAIEQLALAIHADDKDRCRQIGRHGQEVIPGSATVLTHCNTGALATGGIGTALGIIYTAKEQGKTLQVFVDETRPLLQGSRLTAFELEHAGIPATLISDNMAAMVMATHKIDAILVGADRIAANGDTANKIGTYGLAVLAHHHHIPFYIVAPLTTFDLTLENGQQIPIEQRAAEEVKIISGNYISPENTSVFNPAFDITPHHLITAVITDQGIIFDPDKHKIQDFYSNKYSEPKLKESLQ